jgi:hypothetical protein
MTEPKIVVSNREELWFLLAEAAQLEHMIMCQYLYAEFSLKAGREEGLSAEQADAVDRWRGVLRGIAVEEMLHLSLVANVMTSIGAVAPLGRPNFPQRSGYFPSGVQLDLLPFGERALKHFLYLERPEGMERHDAEGFIPVAPPLQPLSQQEAMPRGQEFMTVGHLYRGIEDGLRGLASRLGEHAVFVGSPRAQARPEIVQWPQLIAVDGLDSALRAIAEIIEQGEGARGDWQDAHYGRFLTMWEEYHELRRRDPSFEPAHPVLPAYTRQPFDIRDPMVVVAEPLAHRIAEVTTVAYEMVVQLLLRFFTHTEETDEQLQMLIGSAIDVMAGVVRPLGTALARLPFGPDHPDHTAGFAFEMYYQLTNLVPGREPSWALLHERMSVLVDRCATVAAHEGAPDVVGAAHDRAKSVTSSLGDHVPSELLPLGSRPR